MNQNTDGMNKLNLGCGSSGIAGYLNYDIKNGQHEKAYPLDVDENDWHEIRASHLLEHFGHEETAAVLADWVGKLRPGGILKIAVPDFMKVCEIMKDPQHPEYEKTVPYLMGGHVDENDYHKSAFTKEKLTKQMEAAGLVDIETWESDHLDCSSLEISLNLQGTKPVTSEKEKPVRIPPSKSEGENISYGGWDEKTGPKVAQVEQLSTTKPAAPADKAKIAAVMSIPRLIFADNLFCAMRAFAPMGIDLERGTGAFWSQVLTRMMEKYVNEGYDFIITVDYDTYFTKEQVVELCRLMQANPDVSAIVSTQAKREEDLMLMGWQTPAGQDPGQYITEQFKNNELVEIVTGHFGLTIIDCNALKTMAKPWFWEQPAADGTWNEGRIDSDIYFWHNMKACGKKVMLAPNIKIGHLQQMATFPGTIENGLTPEHHYLNDIEAKGIPEHCKIRSE